MYAVFHPSFCMRNEVCASSVMDSTATPPTASSALRRLLADPSPEVRSNAAFASAILGDQGLADALTPLLGDSDAAVAARACNDNYII